MRHLPRRERRRLARWVRDPLDARGLTYGTRHAVPALVPGCGRGHRQRRPMQAAFPRPAELRDWRPPDSHLLDLAGLLGAATAYSPSPTGRTSAGAAEARPALGVHFDGDPFPYARTTRGPTGNRPFTTARSPMMRVLVNMSRLHVDPGTGLFADDVTLAGGHMVRGATLSADVAAYMLLALRTARRRARFRACPLQQHQAGYRGDSIRPSTAWPARR